MASPSEPDRARARAEATRQDETRKEAGSATDPDSITASQSSLPTTRPTDVPPSSALEGPDAPAHYRLEGEVARGGIGRILRARDLRLERVVALKQIEPGNSGALQRFAREIRITAKLQHPNIIPVYEAGRTPRGRDFYAMRLVEGQSLSEAISHCDTATERLALLPRVIDVAEAIAYAHDQGVIHRDLKPANVLVGSFGETVVIDWGLAKETDDDDDPVVVEPLRHASGFETLVGAVLGTPAYMPPEQAAGQPVDKSADIYAIGAMIYHLLSGHPPYVDEGDVDFPGRVLRGAPTPLSRRAPDAPADLVAVVEKAMEREPARRYASAEELAEELRRFNQRRLVRAYRYTLLEKAGRFAERNRAAVATGFLGILILLLLGVYSLISIAEERDQATQSADKAKASAAAEHDAREVAEHRVDQFIVEKARFLSDTDPTQAVAWLKRLGSPTPGAASVAALAEDRGVAWAISRRHRAEVRSIAMLADGRRVLSAGADHQVLLWDSETNQSTPLQPHTDQVTSVRASSDGRFVVSAGYDGAIYLYETATFERTPLGRHAAPVRDVAFSPDSTRVASIADDRRVCVWQIGKAEPECASLPVDRAAFVTFSPDGRSLLSGGHGGALSLWSFDSGKERMLRGRTGPLRVAAFAPEGDVVAAGDVQGNVTLFGDDGAPRSVLRGSRGSVTALAFAAVGRRLAVGSIDGALGLYDLDRDERRDLEPHSERIDALLFLDAGRRLASAGWDRMVRVHDLETGIVQTLRGHGDVVSNLTARENLLVSGSWDKTLRAWRLGPVNDHERVLRGHEVGVHAVAFSPDGSLLASGGHDNRVRLVELASAAARTLEGHRDHVYRVAFAPDGGLLASSSDDQTVRLWPLSDGAPRELVGHRADVEEIAFSPGGDLLASAAEDHTVRIWQIDSGRSVELSHEDDAAAVAFSPDGSVLATGTRGGSLRLWTVADATLKHEIQAHRRRISSIVWRRDGSGFVTAGGDDAVRFWSSAGEPAGRLGGLTGARLAHLSPDEKTLAVAGVAPRLWLCPAQSNARCRELRGHRALVWDVEFSRNGRLLVSASGDASLSVWDVESGERRELEGHRAPVFDVALWPGHDVAASASADATVRLWPLVAPPKPHALQPFLQALTREEVERP
ncbi:MAG TPA: protein kinase [Polyangiaceae bacterium]